MILRLFLFVGLLLLGGTAYFVVGQQPPTFQSPPAHSELTKLQNEGILPVGPLAEDEELEHGIFDVPARDEVELEAAMANMDMSGMDMSGMDMGTSAEGTDGRHGHGHRRGCHGYGHGWRRCHGHVER